MQLINAQTDSHLWADTYDRKLTDIFGVESEIAKEIAESVAGEANRSRGASLSAKPTDNPEAYDAYLRGLAYTLKTHTRQHPWRTEISQRSGAVGPEIRPYLGAAVIRGCARLHHTIFNQRSPCVKRHGRQPKPLSLFSLILARPYLAKGFYHYACLKDYDTAVRYFEQARPLLPNSSRIPESLAYVERRRGQWDRSETYFNEAERLDPRNVQLLTEHALSYIMLRRFPEALRKLDQVLNITPDDLDTLAIKAAIAQAEGDLPRAAALLAPLHPNADDPPPWKHKFTKRSWSAALHKSFLG